MAPPPAPDGACQEVIREIEAIRTELNQMQQAESETVEALQGELEQLRKATEQILDQLKWQPPGDDPSTVGTVPGYWYPHCRW